MVRTALCEDDDDKSSDSRYRRHAIFEYDSLGASNVEKCVICASEK